MLSPVKPVSLEADSAGADGAAGTMLSTVTVTVDDVNVLPAPSVVITAGRTARRSSDMSVPRDEYGDVVARADRRPAAGAVR